MFSSLNFGTCTKPGGRLATKALLDAMDKGIGKGITAIYPIPVFKFKSGVTFNPGDPNYDLRLMSEKVTAKRQFPNYSNLDAPYNLKYYKEGHPETEAAYMGMASGREKVHIKYACQETEKGYIYKETKIEDVFNALSVFLPVKRFDENTVWIDLESSHFELYLCDSVAGRPVRVKKAMRCEQPETGESWCMLKLKHPENIHWYADLKLTTDHPLCVVNPDGSYSRVAVKDIKVGDKIKASCIGYTGCFEVEDTFERRWHSDRGYDFETESDRFDLGPIVSHNCRTRVIANVNGPEIVTGRGNLSFTSINLPRLAIEASKEALEPELREGIFFQKLDKALEIAAKQLQERFEIQCKRKVYNFPYVMQQGAYMGSEFLSPTDEVRKALLNGTLSFGFVGLAECLRALTGHDHTEGDQYQQLGLKIVKYMRDYADKLTEERHMNWTLIATPAESLAGKFLRKDREEFGIIPGITDKDYYTNSNHVPVGTKVTASEKIRIEAPYHALCNAGAILYIEIEGDPRNNPEVIHTLNNQMHDAGVGYFSYNIKMDTCTACGFVGLIGDTCPSCGQKGTPSTPIMRPRRLTGYLGYEDRFNSAKLAELHDRVTHT